MKKNERIKVRRNHCRHMRLDYGGFGRDLGYSRRKHSSRNDIFSGRIGLRQERRVREVNIRMSSIAEAKEEALQKIEDPINHFKGITEETGFRILYGIYILMELLHQNNSNGAERTTQNQGE